MKQCIQRVSTGPNKDAFTCSMCPENVYLPNYQTMIKHAKDFHDESQAKCEFCDYMPTKRCGKNAIVIHRLSNHKVGTQGFTYYKCQETADGECNFYSMRITNVVEHMLGGTHVSDSARSKVQMPPKLKNLEAKENKGGNVYVVAKVQEVLINNKKYRKCCICGELCIYKKGTSKEKGITMLEHVREKHGGKHYKCEICHKLFGDRLNVALHVKTQHGMQPEGFEGLLMECHYPNCKYVCKTKFDFGRHLVGHKKGLINSNRELENIAFDKILPDEHVIEIPRKLVQCDICGLTCTNKDPQMQLELHMEMEHPTTIKVCEHCGVSYPDEYEYEYHKRSDCQPLKDAKKDYQEYLERNGLNDDSKAMLGMSLPRKPKPPPARVKCPLCKVVDDHGKLVYHFRMIHMGYKRYGCNLCQKRFPSSSNAKYHILRVHEGKGNMDGKLKSVVGVDYFDGKNLLLDYKEAEPGGWPDKRSVLEAIAKAREDNLATVVVTVPVTVSVA